ncbi:hypothetical protein Mapa_012202 [Marchantia paleacea]|nr:hypothetical protein Mapa_012202 [Marchantia paleacea]
MMLLGPSPINSIIVAPCYLFGSVLVRFDGVFPSLLLFHCVSFPTKYPGTTPSKPYPDGRCLSVWTTKRLTCHDSGHPEPILSSQSPIASCKDVFTSEGKWMCAESVPRSNY